MEHVFLIIFQFCTGIVAALAKSLMSLIHGFICKPSIICLSPPWYTLNVPISPLIGYNVVNVPRIFRAGGVCIYVQ